MKMRALSVCTILAGLFCTGQTWGGTTAVHIAPAKAATVCDTAHLSLYSRVFALPAPTAPVIGMIKDTGEYLIDDHQESWYRIHFGNQPGWVQKSSILVLKPAVITAITASPPPPVIRADTFIPPGVTLAARQARQSVWGLLHNHPALPRIIIAAILIAFLTGFLLRRKGPVSVKRQISTIALASKKILMVGGRDKPVRRALSDEAIPIETVFTETGYAISMFDELDQLAEGLGILIPSLIAIDCHGVSEMINRTERLLMRRVTQVNVPVLFYNVPDAHATPRSAILPNIAYLGALPTDWDVLKAINTLHSVNGSPRAIRKSIGSSVLEGSIKGERLTELFHFIETGAKTGHLMVEHENKPFGMICFDKGRIVKAQTRDKMKVDAALAVLGLTAGSFRYMTDRITEQPDCDLTITGIMLEWTKKADETKHMMAVKEERREMERREKERKTAGGKGRDRRGG